MSAWNSKLSVSDYENSKWLALKKDIFFTQKPTLLKSKTSWTLGTGKGFQPHMCLVFVYFKKREYWVYKMTQLLFILCNSLSEKNFLVNEDFFVVIHHSFIGKMFQKYRDGLPQNNPHNIEKILAIKITFKNNLKKPVLKKRVNKPSYGLWCHKTKLSQIVTS